MNKKYIYSGRYKRSLRKSRDLKPLVANYLRKQFSIDDYYMIGGTALSLQLGLRETYDFHFCVQKEFNNELLLEK